MSNIVTDEYLDKFCSGCGTIIKIAAEICPHCGAKQITTTPSVNPNYYKTENGELVKIRNTVSTPSDKSRAATLLFCLILGCLGIHRFYVGKIGTGTLQFLTLGFLGIWTIIDFVLIVVGRFEDIEGKKIKIW